MNIEELNTLSSNRNNGVPKYIAIILVLSVFFNQYMTIIPGVLLGELLCIIAIILVLWRNKRIVRFSNSRSILSFFIVSLLLSLVARTLTGFYSTNVSSMKIASRLLRYFTYALAIEVLCGDKNMKEYSIKLYKWTCIIISIYTILQTILYFTLHILLPFKILPFEFARDETIESLTVFFDSNYYRGFGVFSEPSMLSKFLLPCIAISLNDHSKDHLDILAIILSSVAICCSTSAQGLAILGVTFFLWLFFSKKVSMEKKIGITFIVLLGLVAVLSLGIIDTPLDRLNAVWSGNMSGYSSGVRLFRGFAYWWEMPTIYKIIGCGLGNVANFTSLFSISTPYDYPNMERSIGAMEYMNGISSIMVTSGLIGLCLFVLIIKEKWRHTEVEGKMLLIQFLLILLSGSGFFSMITVFYMFFIYQYDKRY